MLGFLKENKLYNVILKRATVCAPSRPVVIFHKIFKPRVSLPLLSRSKKIPASPLERPLAPPPPPPPAPGPSHPHNFLLARHMFSGLVADSLYVV